MKVYTNTSTLTSVYLKVFEREIAFKNRIFLRMKEAKV
jgi:hypothetical protein